MYSTKNKNTKSKKVYLATALLVFIVLLAAVAKFTIDQRASSNKKTSDAGNSKSGNIDYSPPSQEDKESVDKNKTADVNPVGQQPEVSQPKPATTTKEVLILSAEQDSDKNLVVKTQLSGTGWSECTLRVVNSLKTFSITVKSIYQPQFSTCAGYYIKLSDLNSGTNELTLSAKKSDGQISFSEQKVVSIVK